MKHDDYDDDDDADDDDANTAAADDDYDYGVSGGSEDYDDKDVPTWFWKTKGR